MPVFSLAALPMAMIVAAFDLPLGLKIARSVLWLAAWERAAYVTDGSVGSECDYTDARAVTQG